MSSNRCYSDDDLSLFRDPFLPQYNHESDEEDDFNNTLLIYVPKRHTPQSSPFYQTQIDQNSESPIMEKLAVCRKFGGYPHENASIFLNEFLSYTTLHKIDIRDDPRMIAALHLNLTGPALTWFNALSAEDKRSWGVFQKVFREKYIELDWQSPTVFLESEVFQNMKLSKGQLIEDFYGQVAEKAQILKKQDHEILSQFIKGLPEKLAFFVRAGTHKDSASALAAAKMGEAYGYRQEDEITVAAAKHVNTKVDSDVSKVDQLQTQISELTKAVSELKSQRAPGPRQRPYRNNFPGQPNNFQGQRNLNRSPALCFNCQAPKHRKADCNWNGTGEINSSLQCQLCTQFGHAALQCLKHANPGNQQYPGATGHAPPGGH